MRMNCAIVVLATVAIGFSSVSGQEPQSAASPRDQLQQYVTQLQANPSDDGLRTKIIQLALTLDPKPAITGNAMEHEGAAEYAFKHAQSPADLTSAAAEYEQALLIAPWNAGDYYNLGSCYAKAGDPQKAIAEYQFYLLAAPGAKDADNVMKQIGALKYQLTQKQDHAKQAEAQREVAAQAEREAEAERAAQRRLDGRYSWTDQRRGDTFITDIQQGKVTAGVVDKNGRYNQGESYLLMGHSYHQEKHYDNGGSDYVDGVISDDGSSITESIVLIYANGKRVSQTHVYRRQ